MANNNIKSLFHSIGGLFWFKDQKDQGPNELGDMLDKWSNLRGVACDGSITGLYFTTSVGGETPGPLHMQWERIGGANVLVLRTCDGTEVSRITGT